MEVFETLDTGKYLVFLSMVGRIMKALFNYPRDRLWKKLPNWSGKHLSKLGKEVLIKSVGQTILTYCMSVFLLPTSLSEEMEHMMNSFWWVSNNSQNRGIQWIWWEKLTVRKSNGGMGFRHLYGLINILMLGKEDWKLLTNQDAIITRVFKSKYFPNGDF